MRTQLRAAEGTQELEHLKVVVTGKEKELAEATAEFTSSVRAIADLHNRLAEDGGSDASRVIAPVPRTTPQGLAAGLYAALPKEARASLMELSGVGRKVADCILLFGYGRADVIPVDTHAFQLAQRIFAPQLRGLTMSPSHYETAVKGFQRSFGTRSCGWAFMALFVAELHPFRRYLQADRPKALAAATSPRRGATLVPATPRPRDARKRAALSDVEPAGRVRRKRTRSAACGQGEG